MAVAMFATLGLLMAAPSARGASLQMVSGNWGVSGLPADVRMYIYVPDRRATNPPILTLIHYCGGTAPAVFGQAQGGGIVSAADQYGFIMVVPSSERCWDVQSNKTWTRDGGGDSHAIRQMVRYAIASYSGNPDRVYATGDSSGGMMTELLLALYPDVFKAGSAVRTSRAAAAAIAARVPAARSRTPRKNGGTLRACWRRATPATVRACSCFTATPTRSSDMRTTPRPSSNGRMFWGSARTRRRRARACNWAATKRRGSGGRIPAAMWCSTHLLRSPAITARPTPCSRPNTSSPSWVWIGPEPSIPK